MSSPPSSRSNASRKNTSRTKTQTQAQPKRQAHKVKDEILRVLKVRGAQTAADLADHLGISPMAVRQHLQALRAKAWVTYDEERQPVGRPVKRWRLTQETHDLFPNHHADLVVSLLHSAEQLFGEAGLEELIRHRTEKQIQKYAAQMDGATTWRDRTFRLADLRSQDGYMAEVVEQTDGSLLLVENHCSICAAAQRCAMLCSSELEVFTALLGPDIRLHRIEHLLGGDRRCVYHIAPVQPTP